MLHQDGGHGRLLTRFSAVNGKLERRKGTLGHIKNYQPSHAGIAKATEETIHNFCVEGRGAPPDLQVLELHLAELEGHIKDAVHFFNADAASAQQLAMRATRLQMPGSRVRDVHELQGPN